MTEPLKPRMDFNGTLEQEQHEAFKAAQTFDTTQAEQFAPVVTDMLPAEEGKPRPWWRLPCGPNAACGVKWSAPDCC